MTPLELRILLHYFYIPTPFPVTGPGVKADIDNLVEQGFLVAEREGFDVLYTSTAKNDAFVHALCKVPAPVSVTRWHVNMAGVEVSED